VLSFTQQTRGENLVLSVFLSVRNIQAIAWATAVLTVSVYVRAVAAASGTTAGSGGFTMTFELTSRAFENGGTIPKKFTCDAADVSPSLSWSDPPPGTRSLALISDDPDAPMGTWVHWVAFDIPAGTRELPEGVSKTADLPGGGRQGRTDFGRIGYGGPCPPPGKPHRYYFKLYALDAQLNLKPGSTKSDVEKAMKGHILAQAELMGRYGR
jgi:Raf kinase inhibitor-like YbhB/YbcL family protein